MRKFTLYNSETIRAEVPFEHFEKMTTILKYLLPEELRFEDKSDIFAWSKENLPLIRWNECSSFPNNLIIHLLCLKNAQLQIESIFPDMLRRWILPGKEASILSFSHMYFSPEDLPEKLFFIGEVKILIETAQQWHHAVSNLAWLSSEITIAVTSSQHASYILTKKGALSHVKASSIHRELNQLTQKFPNHIDEKVLDEMGLFLAIAPKEFFKQRDTHHLTRLISSSYLFRKKLLRSLTCLPGIHHIKLRFLPTFLEFPFSLKPVLGCLVGISLIEEYENFESKHILSAIKKLVPQAAYVKSSCYYFYNKEEKIKTLYLELEKEDGSTFSLSERRVLKEKLKEHLNFHIEKLVPPIFMIRNEEDTLRNILMLRREIRSIKDLPQAIISLDQQTTEEIIFNIVLVFLTKPGCVSLQKFSESTHQKYSIFFERSQCVGYFRRKYSIDTHVFRLHLPRESYLLRNDLSLNFYLAREQVVCFLQESIGEFRDYNGGIIFKQTEMLSKFKQQFPSIVQTNPDLIENFFYSISPIEKQAVIPLNNLKTLFQLLLEGLQSDLNEPSSYFLKFEKKGNSTLMVLRFQSSSAKENLSSILNNIQLFSKNLIKSELTIKRAKFLSYIYEDKDQESHKKFTNLVSKTIESWYAKVRNPRVLSTSIPFAPTSLDPRLAGDEFTGNILRLLFEGLMRINKNGQFEYGIAESISVSPNGKHYIFKLRRTKWNNGDPVIAQNFEYAWKKILSVNFHTPFAYLFYPIKNAKKAKQGLVSLDEVGIKTIDDQTLSIELNFPAPYFLELTAHTLYSPINHRVDTFHPNWPMQTQEDYVCNGGFQLKTHHFDQSYELIKNPFYLDTEKIELEKILISKATYASANAMFQKEEIDWLGPPFGPWDSSFQAGKDDRIVSSPDIGVYWYVFNTQRFPFNHLKIRQAFTMAINRTLISNALLSQVKPAFSPLLPFHSQKLFPPILQENLPIARQLFTEALNELGLTKKAFPPINLIYTQGSIREISAQLIKQQLEDAFRIQCRIEPLEWRWAFNKMSQGDFHIGGILWRPLINDPIYFLNTFRHSKEQINFSRWEKAEYSHLLELADHELDLKKRNELLAKAEEILIAEAPVMPVFYTNFKALVKNYIQSPARSSLGILDLKWVTLKNS